MGGGGRRERKWRSENDGRTGDTGGVQQTGPSRAGPGGVRLALTATSSHQASPGMGGAIGGALSSGREGRERQTVACVPHSMAGPAVELEELPCPAEPETALSRAGAGGERLARIAPSTPQCGGGR